MTVLVWAHSFRLQTAEQMEGEAGPRLAPLTSGPGPLGASAAPGQEAPALEIGSQCHRDRAFRFLLLKRLF